MSPKKEETRKQGIKNANAREKKEGCCKCHMNSLGSFGYCIATVGLTAFIITTEVQQLFKYLSLPWPDGHVLHLELNIFIGLVGAAAALVPLYFCAAVLKIGNFANDGFRLGVHDSGCSKDPPPLPMPAGGLLKGAWRHGGPTAPFIHLIISHSLLMARLVMEAAMTRVGFFPKETVWSSEFSYLLPQQDRISILNRLEFYTNNIESSSSDSKFGDYDSSASLAFATSSNEMEKQMNKTSSASNILIGNRGGDTWHIGEIPWGPFTPHLINYLLAHLVYAGRYAAVFWGTNKSLGFFFFIQLLLNTAQNLLAINGFQVLYKVRVVSLAQRVLPVGEGFLLPFVASVALYFASQTLVLASGSVIYLYAYVKFDAFLSAERGKYHILSKHGHESIWSYWPHCWSLTILVFMTGAASPLIYDWTVVYRSSLDSASLAATCGTVAHLFLWILFWMALTLKSRWHFKLRVQVSKTLVTNTHSIRLVNEVQLSQQAEESEGPVMVIGSGKTYLLQEDAPKRAIMKLVLTTLTEKKARGEEEEIYWLHPKPPAVASAEGASWSKKRGASPGVKHKVTFHENATEVPSSSRSHKKKRIREGVDETSDSETSVDSDGDYARLRDVSFPGPARQVRTQDNQSSSNRNLSIPSSHDADSLSIGAEFPAPPPELTNPAHYPPPPDSPPPPLPSGVIIPPSIASTIGANTPTSPRRGRAKNPIINVVRGDSMDNSPVGRDSGMITDCPDSSSTTSSVTPPDKRSDSGVHSQTSTGSSSGTHSKSGSSGSESCVPIMQTGNCLQVNRDYSDGLPPPPPPEATVTSGMPRCSSVDDLCSLAPVIHNQYANVKSYSLQHGVVPSQAYQYQEMHQIQQQQDEYGRQVQHYQQLQYDAHQQRAYQQQQSHNNNNSSHQQNNNERYQQPFPVNHGSEPLAQNGKPRLNIEVIGGGYGFLPPSKYVASEPVYSDASTPVVIRRRSSINAVEPETPPYERSAASFSTFTEPQLPRAVLRGSIQQVLAGHIPGKAMTVGGPIYRSRRPITADAKHATIGGAALPKGFHQPTHIDSRYFSIPAVKQQGTHVHLYHPESIP